MVSSLARWRFLLGAEALRLPLAEERLPFDEVRGVGMVNSEKIKKKLEKAQLGKVFFLFHRGHYYSATALSTYIQS